MVVFQYLSNIMSNSTSNKRGDDELLGAILMFRFLCLFVNMYARLLTDLTFVIFLLHSLP